VKGDDVASHPYDSTLRPTAAVVQSGAMWAVSNDTKCALARFGADGMAACAVPEDDVKLAPFRLHALGASWLLLPSENDTKPSRLFDTSTSRMTRFDECPGARVTGFVEEPPAVAVVCAANDTAGFWTPNTGFRVAGPSPPAWRHVPTTRAERFLAIAEGLYFDAVQSQVVMSAHPLQLATVAGYLFDAASNEAVNAVTSETHPVALRGECKLWGVRDQHGKYAIVTCSKMPSYKEAEELLRRPRSIATCRTRPRPRVLAAALVDLETGESWAIHDAKPISLSDDGLVAIRGSGHDLDTGDGTELVLQPYP